MAKQHSSTRFLILTSKYKQKTIELTTVRLIGYYKRAKY